MVLKKCRRWVVLRTNRTLLIRGIIDRNDNRLPPFEKTTFYHSRPPRCKRNLNLLSGYLLWVRLRVSLVYYLFVYSHYTWHYFYYTLTSRPSSSPLSSYLYYKSQFSIGKRFWLTFALRYPSSSYLCYFCYGS